MAASDWKKALGFTDRLTAIQSLTTAYQRASSSAAFAEAQSQAKRFENEAYNQATSKVGFEPLGNRLLLMPDVQEEYERMCQDAIDAAETTNSVAPMIGSPHQLHNEPEEAAWTAGDTIGPFKGCLHLFDGLHSTIYKSKREDGSVVAVKVTIPHLLSAPHDAEREARLLKEAASPHVIGLLETLKIDGGRLILVFPYTKYNLEHLFRRDMVTGTQTKSYLRDMFSALSHLHKLGIIHRDVKPSNILLNSPAGPAYLADFGIAWKEGDKGSEPADQKITDVGTTCYRAPEVLFGYKGYGTALDLWAAGCVVAEAIAVGHKQLFDSGPVGSDLSLVQSIFHTLGTPDATVWPETAKLPDWGKIEFYKYPPKPWDEVLRGASSRGRDLVSKLVRYEGSERLSAAEVLDHPYFSAT
ncbi:putative cell division protein kinase (Ctk1) [Aspergillus clavatus NRRL 1]|uniref:cyclin-dependent kinase n=1 Tax=Aspergillus clavatus (strain ATCC 1007 / CBS 513.65 / DSM 816 / NCTC 3887 / NRRL 1 / QM 1276 / 107) TaxID=344612 RepID=A1CP97_ASPCL|nr:cell division protein kinase (Ctk1), putative [Aspergillus clavatus NRRL 1]EAW07468.1 cell division protein kinase (Ctk1), putative [Aspergillus clavatus NRRL 1]